MHFLMSFDGCVNGKMVVLMANSSLDLILKSAFGGVAMMLTGKK